MQRLFQMQTQQGVFMQFNVYLKSKTNKESLCNATPISNVNPTNKGVSRSGNGRRARTATGWRGQKEREGWRRQTFIRDTTT